MAIVAPNRPYIQASFSDIMEMNAGLFFRLLEQLEDLDLKYRGSTNSTNVG